MIGSTKKFLKYILMVLALCSPFCVHAQTYYNGVPSFLYPPGYIPPNSFDDASSIYPGGSSSNYSGIFESSYTQPNYGTNLWLEITNVNFTLDGGQSAGLMLHNTTNNIGYEIWKSTNILGPWIPDQSFNGDNGSTPDNISLDFYQWEGGEPYWWPDYPQPNMYFLAIGLNNPSSRLVEVYPSQNTTVHFPTSSTDTSQNVTSDFYYGGFTNTLNARFKVVGNATYGVDYTFSGMTYSNGFATLSCPVSGSPEPFTVEPIYTTNATFDSKYVTLALTPGPYYANLGVCQSTVTIDPTPIPITLVTNLPESYQDGIDYDPVLNTLLLSANDPTGDPNNYMVIGTNSDGSIFITNWSNVFGVPNEVETAVVKTSTNNFVKGDVYFADDDQFNGTIDKLSCDGTNWIQDWCDLTNAGLVTGICIDQTGVFNHDLIAVSDYNTAYRIHCDTNGNPVVTELSNIPAYNPYSSQFAGVTTLPNDPKWGPWAGKIITGDSDLSYLYGIDTNGVVTTNEQVGIYGECCGVIPTNEDLYMIDTGESQLLKISRTALAPYVGDLVINQSLIPTGDGPYPAPAVYILEWDTNNCVFKIHPTHSNSGGIYEDFTFAPLNLPSQ
jgi:hypothetical protein